MMKAHEPHSLADYLADPDILPPRILLAEDDAEMRAFVSDDLRRTGYSVIECPDGAALIRRLDNPGGVDGIGVDLVVADLQMPEFTGIEVLERLRRADPFTPFIVVTAFGSRETHQAAMRLGAIAVLDKPFEMRDLLRLVEDAVGRPSPNRS